jgi:hypothetical protein
MARSLASPVTAISGLVLVLSLGLGGCASGGMLDQLPPALGGEPAHLPARPQTGYQFPAVHDMPPARANAPLSDNEQIRLEKELQTARDKQEALAKSGAPAAMEPAPASAAKKKPAAAKSGQTSGAKTNP